MNARFDLFALLCALNPVPPESVVGVERSAAAQTTLARILSQPGDAADDAVAPPNKRRRRHRGAADTPTGRVRPQAFEGNIAVFRSYRGRRACEEAVSAQGSSIRLKSATTANSTPCVVWIGDKIEAFRV